MLHGMRGARLAWGLLLSALLVSSAAASASPWRANVTWKLDKDQYHPGDRGRVVDVSIKNLGPTPIRVLRVGVHFDWMTGAQYYLYLDLRDNPAYVDPGEKVNLGSISFVVPASVSPGEHSFYLYIEAEELAGPGQWQRGSAFTSEHRITIVAKSPELALRDVRVPPTALRGERLEVSGRVENRGSGEAMGVRVTLTLDGRRVATKPLPVSLAPGGSAPFSLAFVVPDWAQEGSHELVIRATCSEGSEDEASFTITVERPTPPPPPTTTAPPPPTTTPPPTTPPPPTTEAPTSAPTTAPSTSAPSPRHASATAFALAGGAASSALIAAVVLTRGRGRFRGPPKPPQGPTPAPLPVQAGGPKTEVYDEVEGPKTEIYDEEETEVYDEGGDGGRGRR